MSTAALTSGALTSGVVTPATEVTQSPGRRVGAAGSPGRPPNLSRPAPAPARCWVARRWAATPRRVSRSGLARRQAGPAAWSTGIEPSTLRLTRRGKALLTTVSVLVFGAAIAVLGLRVAGVLDPQPTFGHTIQVQVGAGQTLWSIAQETNPTEDPTVVVEKIADLNNLRNAADVVPGQTLQIPVR